MYTCTLTSIPFEFIATRSNVKTYFYFFFPYCLSLTQFHKVYTEEEITIRFIIPSLILVCLEVLIPILITGCLLIF